ncbi:MAG TPA: ERCC4 domain-containing protein [Planctomycetota bacterium]|nr:ERCC4 domain-containing protein [Planctomycetota bacterium]
MEAPTGVEADDRERGSPTVRALEAAGVPVRFVRLKAGDYRIPPSVVVARKTFWDFRASLSDGRLFAQVARLSAAAPRPLLLVEGLDRGGSMPSLRGAILTITGVFGIPVLFSADAADSVQWVVGAARLFAQRKPGTLPRPGGRPRGKRARQLFALQGLPAVGPARAEALLDRFGTLRAVLNASEQDLREVPGIGPRIARAILWLAT